MYISIQFILWKKSNVNLKITT